MFDDLPRRKLKTAECLEGLSHTVQSEWLNFPPVHVYWAKYGGPVKRLSCKHSSTRLCMYLRCVTKERWQAPRHTVFSIFFSSRRIVAILKSEYLFKYSFFCEQEKYKSGHILCISVYWNVFFSIIWSVFIFLRTVSGFSTTLWDAGYVFSSLSRNPRSESVFRLSHRWTEEANWPPCQKALCVLSALQISMAKWCLYKHRLLSFTERLWSSVMCPSRRIRYLHACAPKDISSNGFLCEWLDFWSGAFSHLSYSYSVVLALKVQLVENDWCT